MTTDGHRNALPPGYKLHWYHIEKILGQGGFGITYLATDTNLNRRVAIKEYLPVEMAVRQDRVSVQPVSGEYGEQFKWGLDRFISEAQTLARFSHPNIVRVHAVFSENNTAYMVMEYESGRGLDNILKERKTLSEEELKRIIYPVLSGLEVVHAASFIHRDIKPPNIYIRNDNSPVLLDFGSARQSLNELTRTLTTMVSPGYAPFEQYAGKSMKQGPWTDIYGIGATMYRAVTGISPPDSMDRSESILHTGRDIYVTAAEICAGRYAPGFLAAIDHALAFKPDDRPRNVGEWCSELEGSTSAGDVNMAAGVKDQESAPTISIAETAVVPEKEHTPQQDESAFDRWVPAAYRTVRKILKWLLIILVVLVVLAIVSQPGKKNAVPDQPTSQVTQPQGTETPQLPEAGTEIPAPAMDAADDRAGEIENLLQAAEKDIAALRLTSPGGNNAVEKFRKVLEMDPGNRRALQGLDQVVGKYISLMNHAIDSGNIAAADNYLAKAEAVNPAHPELAAARARLERARLATVPEPPAEKSQPDPRQGIPVEEKQILSSLKERLRANPQDPEARSQLQEVARKYQENIEKAVDEGNYQLAREYIREVQAVSSDNPRALRRLNELLRRIDQKERENRL
jgi:serine/threonine protein kinase